MRSTDAEKLWRRFGAGDGSAFTQLYSDHHGDVVRYCRSLLHDEEDAQDAAQGTWTAIWTRPDAARRDIPLRPWLFRVAHNESISIIRRRRTHDPLSDLDLPALDDVAGDVELRDRLASLRADLVNLPERQRVALLSRELGGLGHSEIAEVLGISTAAAKQAIYEARRALVEADTGRSLACDLVQRALSDGDGRARRGRRLGAHLRACAGCRAFADGVGRRRRDLRLLFPAPAMLGLLARAAASTSAGGAGGSLVAAGGGSVATKLVVVVAVIAAAGVGGQREPAPSGGVAAKGSGASRAVASEVAAAPVRTSAPRRPVGGAAMTVALSAPRQRRPSPDAPSAKASPGRPHDAGPRSQSGGPAPGAAPVEAPVAAKPTSVSAGEGAGQVDKPAGRAVPPGQAKKADPAAVEPPGQAKKADPAVVPPGQAKKSDPAVEPPGQAKKADPAVVPPGQAKKADDAAAGAALPTTSPSMSEAAAAPSDTAPGRFKDAISHGKFK